MVDIALIKLVFRVVGPKNGWCTVLLTVRMVKNVPNIDVMYS
jgi:hypothetical protein